MINFYPIPNKRKCRLIGEAFIAGCNARGGEGAVVLDNTLRDGDAAFYGVDFTNEHIYRSVLHDHSRNFYYIDNSYFDPTREIYFRVSKNMLQHDGVGTSDCTRFDTLGLSVDPWRKQGKHIVICEQSASFMQMPAGYSGDWLTDLLGPLRQLTPREIRIRKWERDKRWNANPLSNDLENAHALIAWSSAALVTAIIAGVPVVAMGQSACTPLSGSLADLENLPTPDRHEWLGLLADNQFTLEEMRSGFTWERVNGKRS